MKNIHHRTFTYGSGRCHTSSRSENTNTTRTRTTTRTRNPNPFVHGHRFTSTFPLFWTVWLFVTMILLCTAAEKDVPISNRMVEPEFMSFSSLSFLHQVRRIQDEEGLWNYFECTVIEASPIMAPLHPGERPPDEMKPLVTCSAALNHANNGERISLLFNGDTDAFFQGMDLASGTVSLRIPVDLVLHDTIPLDAQSIPLIIVASVGSSSSTNVNINANINANTNTNTNTHPNARRLERRANHRHLRSPGPGPVEETLPRAQEHPPGHRHLQTSPVATTGQMKVVIVRLSDDTSNDAKTISTTPYQMMTDFFYDENNLASVYQACSNGKLTFVPAWGKDTVKYKDPITKKTATTGVVNIKPPTNICSMDWKTAGNYALAQMSSKNYWATHKVIIMPNCVNFNGAAAWGETPGDTTWFKAQYYSYPVTQVHEIGHNLGLRHSGRGTDAYGDGTGYMSALAPWTDAGAKMCFNPAKMWYLGWYSEYHHWVDPLTNAYIGNLVPIDDVAQKKWLVSAQDVVIQVQSNYDSVFIAYNRAKGANQQVVQEADKVVITRQASQFSESSFQGSVSSYANTFTMSNWGNSGKDLVVKLCKINTTLQSNDYDYAKIIVYVSGQTDIDCNGNAVALTTSANDVITSTSTVDKCPLDATWYDIDGPYFNCKYYAVGNRCQTMGDSYARNGHTANTACCACMN